MKFKIDAMQDVVLEVDDNSQTVGFVPAKDGWDEVYTGQQAGVSSECWLESVQSPSVTTHMVIFSHYDQYSGDFGHQDIYKRIPFMVEVEEEGELIPYKVAI